MLKENSKIVRLAKKVDTNLENWKLVKIFISISLIISLTEFILFATGNSHIEGVDETNQWLGYVSLSIGLVASLFAFMGFTLSVTRNKNFFWWTITAQTMYLLNSIIFNLWFSTIKLAIVFGIRIHQRSQWGKNEDNTRHVKTRKLKPGILISMIIMLFSIGSLMGWGMSFTSGDFQANHPYIDGITFVSGLTSSFLVATRYRDGYIFGFIGNLLMTIVYFKIGQYTLAVSNILFMVLIFSGFVNWSVSATKKETLEELG